MALLLAILGVLALAATVLGLTCPRRPFWALPVTFFVSWLAGDLAAFHLVAQVAVTALAVGFGALERTAGVVGLVAMVLSWIGLAVLARRQRAAAPVLDAALVEIGIGVGETLPSVAAAPVPRRVLLNPFVPSRDGVTIVKDLAYGEHRRHRLDVLKPADGRTGCPVLLQIHGGGWTIGNKYQQGQPLMRHLARNGWVCVAPNYRLSPTATFPDHLIDVKRALAWARQHITEHGGDPSFVAVTGGSAGGHLAALVGLTPNEPRFQPGFEDVDTSVQACVPVYGVFDFLDRHGLRLGQMEPMLRRLVMKTSPSEDFEGWSAASPLSHIRRDAPPFFVIQGSNDTLVWVEEARRFVADLRIISTQPVAYAEIPYAQHAFDVMVTRRSLAFVRAVEIFLESVRSRHVG